MSEAAVKKCEPLKCPQCESTNVTKSFNRRVKRAYLPDGRIWCNSCKKVTNLKTGKVMEIKTDYPFRGKQHVDPVIIGRGEERAKGK